MIMVPIYAISSLISLFSLEAAFFIDAVRDIYEVRRFPGILLALQILGIQYYPVTVMFPCELSEIWRTYNPVWIQHTPESHCYPWNIGESWPIMLPFSMHYFFLSSLWLHLSLYDANILLLGLRYLLLFCLVTLLPGWRALPAYPTAWPTAKVPSVPRQHFQA